MKFSNIVFDDPIIIPFPVRWPRKYVKRVLKASIAFPIQPVKSDRAYEVERQFSLTETRSQVVVYDDFELEFKDGDIILITGESGGGKSLLLDEFARLYGDQAIVSREMTIDPDEVLVEGVGETVDEALYLLAMVGLGEATLFVRRFRELSDGQKYRYELAKLLDTKKRVLVIDEFCSTLDRTTARVVAYLMRKVARRQGLTLILATAHDDLGEDLDPDIHIVKPFGYVPMVWRGDPKPHGCSIAKGMKLEEGSLVDYKKLERFHYRGFRPCFVKKVYRLVLENETIGVIVYVCSYQRLKARQQIFGHKYDTVQDVNRDILRIARVVVAPRFRGIGLGVKLVRDTLPLCGVKIVETMAAMAKYNPFFEHAGMKLGYVYTKKKPTDPVFKGIVKYLESLGFDLSQMHRFDYVEKFVASQDLVELQRGLAKTQTVFRRHKKSFERQKRIRKGTATARDVAMLIHQYASFFAVTYYYYWVKEGEEFG